MATWLTKPTIRALILCTAALCISAANTDEELVTRETKYGQLQGWSIPFYDNADMRLDVFVGVPYANPPIGELRWRDPEEPGSWSGVRNATQFSPCCTQNLATIRVWSFGPDYNNTSEDCLYLNIYAPRFEQSTSAPSRTFPVMVWIHGGSYLHGSGEEYAGRYLAQEEVVVITLNYRLGELGFLSTDDATADGNYGLKDIVRALKWVKDNVAYFGGDPEAVTIFGNSAGSAAVSTLMFVDEAAGLFHRVIAQSGDALSPWAVYRPPESILPHTQALAEALGCPTQPNPEMVDCLRGKNAMEIVNTPVKSTSRFNEPFCPRVDGKFLKAPPEVLLEQGTTQPVDFLTGTVPNEAVFLFAEVPAIEAGWSREQKESLMFTWSRLFEEHADLIYSALLHEYDSPGDDWQRNRDDFIEMQTDSLMIAPNNLHARGHSALHDNTYLYSFEYLSENVPFPEWMGVPHVEEVLYVFGMPFLGDEQCPWGCHGLIRYNRQNWTEADLATSRLAMETWAAFAKTGDPSTPSFTWPKFNATAEYYADLGSTWSAQQFYKYRRVDFWNSYFKSLLNATVECGEDDVIAGTSKQHMTSFMTLMSLGIAVGLR